MAKLFKHKWIIIPLIFIPIIVVIGQRLVSTGTTTNTTNTTAQVQKGTITSSIAASGTIQTANYLAITTSVNGIVKKVYVAEGTKVAKDQKIMEVTLDSEGERSLKDAYASYLRAKNSGDSAKNSLYALESTMLQKKEAFDNEKKHNSYQTHDERLSYKYAENEYLKAKNDFDLQNASITQAQISLESAYSGYQAFSPTILAPAEGVIANIVATEGTKISNSVTSDRSVQTVASIKQEGTPTASLNVTELDINSVKVGQKVKLTLSSVTGQTFDGVVAGIDKIGTQSSGVSNYPVIIKFNSDDERVLPNMSVTAEIITESHDNVLYVPTGALHTNQNGKYVLVQEGTNQKMVTVKTGIADSSNTEILEGLNGNETVIISAYPTSGFTTSTNSSSSKTGTRTGNVVISGPPPGM